MIPAAITAAAGIASLVGNNAFQKNRYQQQLADERKNWYMQNQFNSPSAQMERLKIAGLNPNLVYQNGGAVQPSGEMSTPEYDYTPIDLATVAGTAFQNMSIEKDLEQKEAQTQLIKQETIDKALRNKWLEPSLKSELFHINASTQLMQQQRDYYSELTGLTQQQIRNSSLEYDKIGKEIQILESQNKINSETVKQIKATIRQIDANTNLISKQAQQAVLNNWFLKLKQSANSNPRDNIYTNELNKVREEIDQLQWFNNEYYRQSQLVSDPILKGSVFMEYRHHWKNKFNY